MTKSTSGPRRLGHWLVPVMAICIGVPALMTLQGCCKSCCPRLPTPTVQPVTVFLENGETCALPLVVKARRDTTVVFINATNKPVTIKPTVDYPVFAGGNEVTLGPNESRKVKIIQDAKLGGFGLNVSGWNCSGYPGPRMEIDG